MIQTRGWSDNIAGRAPGLHIADPGSVPSYMYDFLSPIKSDP